jgi:hypothetical protein
VGVSIFKEGDLLLKNIDLIDEVVVRLLKGLYLLLIFCYCAFILFGVLAIQELLLQLANPFGQIIVLARQFKPFFESSQ